jgi:AraC-like DNA-binding protein
MAPSHSCLSILLSIPLVSALVCAAVTALDMQRAMAPVRRKLHLHAMLAFGVFALFWSTLAVGATVLFVPVAVLAQVLLWRMIRTLTDSGDDSRLPRRHLVLPAVMAVIVAVMWATGVWPLHGGWGWAVYGVCFACGVVYPAMSLRRIVLFQKQNTHAALGRFFGAILLEAVLMPVPVYGLLLGLWPFADVAAAGWPEWVLWVVWSAAVLPSWAMYIMSCFNLLSDNYIVFEADQPSPGHSTPSVSNGGLSRERVDRYIETKKPWLNPAFRLSDMAEDLYSNRAYVSAFINSEYGMNFNRFVNNFRLAEVERLREEASRRRQRVSMLQLILNAGFSSYRSYLRAKDSTSAKPGGVSVY